MESEQLGYCQTLMRWVRSWCTFGGWIRGSYSLSQVEEQSEPLLKQVVQQSPSQDGQESDDDGSYQTFCSGVFNRPPTGQRPSLAKYPPLPAESTTVDLTQNTSTIFQDESN